MSKEKDQDVFEAATAAEPATPKAPDHYLGLLLKDRYLVVKGQLRTYRIHLGSGNIIMDPGNKYLCIVADRRSSPALQDVFLPFEGDSTLSLILSKAFLLAQDSQISDPSILNQINK